MRAILFKPVNITLWAGLLVVISLSGQYPHTATFNLSWVLKGVSNISDSGSGGSIPVQLPVHEIGLFVENSWKNFTKSSPAVMWGGIVFIVMVILAWLALLWIRARSEFIYRDLIVKGHFRLKEIWRLTQRPAHQYFIAIFTLKICAFMYYIMLGWSAFIMIYMKHPVIHLNWSDVIGITLEIFPFVIFGLLFGVVYVLIKFILLDIVVPNLYVNNLSLMDSHEESLNMLMNNKKDFFVYILLKSALNFLGQIIIGALLLFVFLMIFAFIMVSMGVSGLVFLMPTLGLKWVLPAVLGKICGGLFLTVITLYLLIETPLILFLGIMNFKFLESLERFSLQVGWDRSEGL